MDANSWAVIAAGITIVVGGAAAIFTWVQAHAALESLKDARAARDEAKASAEESARLASEANAAFLRQAEAQEEANKLKILEMTPPDWTGPTHLGGDAYRMLNSSRTVLHVTDIDVQPERFAPMLKIRSWQPDGTYELGDVIEFLAFKSLGGGPEKMTIFYTREGSDAPRRFVVRL
ncbi:hypothetical protein LJR044_002484 [Microbacterium foliorum]